MNFTTSSPSQGEEIYGLKNVKLIYFLKKSSSLHKAKIRQTSKYIHLAMITKEGSTKIEKFHDPRARYSCVRERPYKLYSENALLFLKFSFLLPDIDQTN